MADFDLIVRNARIVTAERQTGGRGRRGRPWISEAGNLYASLLLIDPAPLARLASLPLAVAVAVHDAVRQVLPADAAPLEIKWPNDLLMHDKKVGGILCELLQVLEAAEAAQVGITDQSAAAGPQVVGVEQLLHPAALGPAHEVVAPIARQERDGFLEHDRVRPGQHREGALRVHRQARGRPAGPDEPPVTVDETIVRGETPEERAANVQKLIVLGVIAPEPEPEDEPEDDVVVLVKQVH